jgi:hypothetical protein
VSGIEEITYALDFCANKRSRRESTATPHPSPADGNDSSIPRIARLMALAIRFDGLLRGETFRDYGSMKTTLMHLGSPGFGGCRLGAGPGTSTNSTHSH